MEGVPPYWTVVPGLFAGLFYVALCSKWASLFLSAIGRLPEPLKQGAVNKASTIGIVLSMIHPAPWLLLVGVPYALVHFYQRPSWLAWVWFIGTALIVAIAQVTFVLSMIYRNRREIRKKSEAGPA